MKYLKTLTLLSVVLFLLQTCKSTDIKGSADVIRKRQDSLAFELCKIYGLDQGIRKSPGMPNKWNFMLPIDSINFFKILDFTKTHGFPNKKILGQENYSHECVQASAIAILLHTPHILVNNKEYLDVFIEETNKETLKKETLALILDKYYAIRRDEFGNRRQLYGSQFGKPCKKFRRESDSVRAVIGLAPLPDSLFVQCKSK